MCSKMNHFAVLIIPVWAIYTMEMKALGTKDTCVRMFSATLFIEAKHWERLECNDYNYYKE